MTTSAPRGGAPHGATSRGAAVRLAAAALALSVFAVVVLSFASGMPLPLRVVVLVVSGVAAPLLTVIALLLLITPAIRLGRAFETAVVAAAAVAFVADLLFVVSFSTGMDEADAGTAVSVFGRLKWIFALVSAAGFVALVALLFFVLLRRDAKTTTRVAIAISVPVAVVVAPFLVWSITSPLTAVLPALAVTIVALSRSARPRPAGAAPRPLVDAPLLARRVRTLAVASLAYTVVVWGGALSASIAATGTDGATSALGVASGAGQLAVIPLLLAGTLVAVARSAGDIRALWAGTIAAIAAVAAIAVSMVVAYAPDGDAFVRDLGVLALAVGIWCAAALWSLTAGRPAAARVGIAVVGLLGGWVVYLFGAALTAGITLVLASGFLAFGGTRWVVRAPKTTTLATLPASA